MAGSESHRFVPVSHDPFAGHNGKHATGSFISESEDGQNHKFLGVFASENHAADIHKSLQENRANELGTDPEDVEDQFHLHPAMPIIGGASKGDALHIVHSISEDEKTPAIHGIYASKPQANAAAEEMARANWEAHGPEFDPAGPEDFHPKAWKEYSANWKKTNPGKPSLEKLWDKIPEGNNITNTPEAKTYFDSVMSAAGKKEGDKADYPGLGEANSYFENRGETGKRVMVGKSKLLFPRGDLG